MWSRKLEGYDFKDEKLFRNDCTYKRKSTIGSRKAREAGNGLFKKKKHSLLIHKQILIKYSKSIALAPSGTEELALAYGNRSYLLLHLNKYEETIIDCDYALQININSNVFKIKLLRRKIFCLRVLNKISQAQTIFEEAITLLDNVNNKVVKDKLLKDLNNAICQTSIITEQSNELNDLPKNITNSLPYLSPKVSLINDEKFGIHFIANQDIKLGEIVLIDKKYCAHPSLNEIYIVCSHCLKQVWNGIPCNHCVFAMYCSNDCKNEAWERYHDVECKTYPHLFSRVTYLSELTQSRLFIQILKEVGIEKLLHEIELDKMESENCAENLRKNVTPEELLATAGTFQFFNYLKEDEHYKKKDSLQVLKCHEESATYILEALKLSKYFDTNKNFSCYNRKLKDILFKIGAKCSLNNSVVNAPDFSKWLDPNHGGMDNSFELGCVNNTISCFFNHSCFPNIDEIEHRLYYASRSIKKDEQLFVSFGPLLTHDVTDRQAYLKRKFYYHCKCVACVNKWPVVANIYEPINLDDITKIEECTQYLENNNLLYLFNDIKSWMNKENVIEDLGTVIDKVLAPKISIHQLASILTHFMDNVNLLFFIKYGSAKFEIPEDCTE